MRLLRRTLISSAIALALAASGNAAAQYSNVYFFGDSLIDSGNYKSVLPPGTGLFTTNPGPVMSQVIAQRFGFAATPSTQTGGNNYAYGGARVALLPGVVGAPLSPSAAVPVATQVQQYLAKGPADPNALYSVSGGGNDFFCQFGLLAAGAATPAQVQTALGTAAVQLATQAALLKAAGARNIMVWYVPDVGTSLDGAATGQGPTLTALSNFFNSTLGGALDTLGVQGIRLNSALIQNEILKNPATFGLKNVTGIACTVPPDDTIALCKSSTLVSPDAPNTYFFANGSHPTTAGHQIFGDYAISFIDGPQQMGALAEAPLAVEQASFRALDGRMWSSLNAPRSQGKLEGWAAYDYGHSDLQAGASNGSSRTNSLAVGGDVKVSDRMLVRLMAAFAENKGNFGGAGGGYTMKAPVGTLYAGYGDGPWYVGATMGAGSLDYSDINRAIPLGAGVRNESAEARGTEYTGRLLGGYWFTMKDLLHGPYARLTWTKASVHAFSETSTDSTALYYDEQNRYQLLWSAGWQVAGSFGAIRPFARVTWEYDSRDQERTVGASSVTLGGNYSVPVAKPDNSYALFNLGASTEFGGVTGFLTGSGTAGRGEGNYWAVTVGLRMSLWRARPSTQGAAAGGPFLFGATETRARPPLSRIAAACAARARTARRKPGAAESAIAARPPPSARGAHRSACGGRSRGRCAAPPRPRRAGTASDRDSARSSASRYSLGTP
jgi:outer membrane lipase/esterase